MTSPDPEPDPLVGQLVEDRYQVIRLLGKGGMGAVYEVEHLEIQKRMAMKVLLPMFATDAQVVARFKREAIAASSIGNEHIIEVTDFGRLPDGSAFMALELLRGEDLSERLERTGPLPVGEAVRIVQQICDGLEAAHQQGIVHRDIKPENVYLVRRRDGDFVKVLDFGISKMADLAHELSGGLTKTNHALGTPYYMAPEQLKESKSVDARADLYALGVLLFNVLTGHHPFDAASYPELVIMIVTEEPPSVASYRSDVPPGLAALVAQLLSKERDQRPASAAKLRELLDPFADCEDSVEIVSTPQGVSADVHALGATLLSTPPGHGPELGIAEGLATPSPVESAGADRPPTRSRLPSLAAISAASLLVGVVIFWKPWADDGPSESEVTTQESGLVRVELSAEPASARISVDGRAVANPTVIETEASDQLHWIEVRAAGHITRQSELRFDASRVLVIRLERSVGSQAAPEDEPQVGTLDEPENEPSSMRSSETRPSRARPRTEPEQDEPSTEAEQDEGVATTEETTMVSEMGMSAEMNSPTSEMRTEGNVVVPQQQQTMRLW